MNLVEELRSQVLRDTTAPPRPNTHTHKRERAFQGKGRACINTWKLKRLAMFRKEGLWGWS